MRSIVSLTERSLPGIGVAEKTTVSPEWSSTSRWSPCAIRRSAESGSPWLPVEIAITFSSGKSSISCGWISRPVGRVRDPEVGGDVEVLAHRAPDQRDLAVELRGGVDHLLDAVDVGGEAGDDDPALAAARTSRAAPGRRSTPRARRRGGRRWSSRRRGRAAPSRPSSASRAKSAGVPSTGRLVELVVAGDQDRARARCAGRRRARRGSSATCGSSRSRTGPP